MALGVIAKATGPADRPKGEGMTGFPQRGDIGLKIAEHKKRIAELTLIYQVASDHQVQVKGIWQDWHDNLERIAELEAELEKWKAEPKI